MPANLKEGASPSAQLLDAIAAFPTHREVSHCGATFRVPAFDLYATCPACGSRVKVRGFGAATELEDVFDALFAWMQKPGAAAVARERQQTIAADDE